MSYIEEKVLSGNEHIVKRATISKIPLFWWWVGGILGCWLLLIPTIKAIKATLAYRTTEYVITDKKVIEKRGIVSVRCDEMLLEKVENVVVQQSFWGRLCKFGTVIIKGTNRDNIYFVNIKDYLDIKEVLNGVIGSRNE